MKTVPSISVRASLVNGLFRRLPAGLAVAVALAGSLALATPARAASIGVNFGFNSAGFLLPAATSAGVVPQTNFNNVTGTVAGLALNNNAGIATTALLTVSGTGSGFTTQGVGGDEMLNAGFIGNGGNPVAFTLAGIPYASYSVYVYDLAPGAGRVQGITLGTTTYYTSSPDPNTAGYVDSNAATAFIYTPSASTDIASPVANSDYVLFSGLTGTSVTVTATGGAGFPLFTGFQIVDTTGAVPEPSTWIILAAGAGLLSLDVLRRRRCV